jgi:hypothetical protein
MKNLGRYIQIAVSLPMIALTALPASATNYCSGHRHGVASPNFITGDNISCGTSGGTATAGTLTSQKVLNGNVVLTADKLAGVAGLGVGITGFNSSGTIVCTVLDVTIGGTSPVICPPSTVTY